MIDAATIDRARSVTIESVLAQRRLLACMRRHGSEYVGPCPRCGGTDRFSFSIRKQFWNCRQCKPGSKVTGNVIGLVCWLDNVPFPEAVEILLGEKIPAASKPAPSPKPPSRPKADYATEQHRKARWLWSERRPIIGSIAENYLRDARGYRGPLPPTLAFLPPKKPEHHPALLACFTIAGEAEPGVLAEPRAINAVHLTLLAPDGSGKADAEPNKLIVGSPGIVLNRAGKKMSG